MQQTNLEELEGGMQPGSIGPKQDFVSTRAPHRLNQVVESAHARCVGKDIRVPNALIYYVLMGSPIIAKTSQMWHDKVHLRKLRREHFDDMGAPNDIAKDRQAEAAGNFAHLTGR